MSTPHQPHAHHAAENIKAIAAILAGTVFFTVVDIMMKLTSANLPVGESMVIRNGFATALIVAFAVSAGQLSLPDRPPWPGLIWRMIGEGGSTIAFLTALAALPIAEASGITQFTPLAITAAAAVFLKERVGWRRWTATLVGLVGVMLIMRPGTAGFSVAGLLVLVSIALIVVRDFATRSITASISTMTLTAMSSLATLFAGLLMLPFETWITPSPLDLVRLGVAALFLIAGYVSIIIAMRTGEVSAATPFRYFSMVIALAAGWLIWNEVPDEVQLAGMGLVCAAGLYTLRREHLRHRGDRK